MKTIKINFTDFWSGFDKENNDFINTLKKHFDVVLSDNPDYLFYSCFGNEYYKYDCIRIFYTGECVTPNFNECDYAIGFDRLDFGDRYIRFPLYFKNNYWNRFQKRETVTKDLIDNKSEFCSFVYSNGSASYRKDFFEKLSEYKQVNSGGRYLNNIGGPIEDKLEFQKKHKFSIAFENQVYPGYITEKILDSFAANTIPIYFGAPDVEQDFNKDAFINCSRFSNFDEVVEHIKLIDNDNELYLKMLNEKPLLANDTFEKFEHFLVNIVLIDLQEAKRRPVNNFSNFNGKIFEEYIVLKKNERTSIEKRIRDSKIVKKYKKIINK